MSEALPLRPNEMFVVLQKFDTHLMQCQARNKTYKSVDTAIQWGIVGSNKQIVSSSLDRTVVIAEGRTFVIVRIGDVVAARAQLDAP